MWVVPTLVNELLANAAGLSSLWNLGGAESITFNLKRIRSTAPVTSTINLTNLFRVSIFSVCTYIEKKTLKYKSS